MSNYAVRVEHLSKRYRIGVQDEQQNTLLGTLGAWIKSPLTNYRKLSRLTRFTEEETAGDVVWALQDVSFDIQEGQVAGIIGHNGAGKSTLLKILSRITEPSAGRVTINGRVSSLLEVGTGFHPELTGRDNVYLNGTILGMSKAEIDRKFDEIVDFSGIERYIDTPVKRYSSGMKVRLAFSVAAHLEPEVLLIDEVLAVGDVAFQRKCIGKMQNVAGLGRTVLFVSHNMGMVNTLTERVVWLDGGRLHRQGPTSEVVQAYLDSYDAVPSGAVDLSGYDGMLQSVAVLQDGRPTAAVRMGAPISIEVSYRSRQPLRRPVMGIGVDHTEIGRILSLSTRLVPCENQPEAATEGTFVCHVDSFPLNQGTYYLTFQLSTGEADVQRIERACKIQVVPDDVFGTGRILLPTQGLCFVPQTWQHRTPSTSSPNHTRLSDGPTVSVQVS